MSSIQPEALFIERPIRIWGLIFLLCIYVVLCWAAYTAAVEPLYGVIDPPTIGADSGSYYDAAGLGESGSFGSDNFLALGGSSLGPALVAVVCRTPFGVACFNCILFLVVIWLAGFIPGVNRIYFAILMAIEPQLMPTLMTLNKEMLAIAGLVSFCVYLYGGQAEGRRRGSTLFLLAAFIFSFLGRWQQVLIFFWYLTVEANWSPLRGKPRKAIVALLLFLSVAWFAAMRILHLNLGGFIAGVEGGSGTVARLYAVQEKGGFFLIALPKIIMYLGGRWVTPFYFLTGYWSEDFGNSWQNQYIGVLSSFCMLAMPAIVILRGRFRLDRPLIHLTLIYYICTAVNPFIQPRYIYPAYLLLALEMSRKVEMLEPVKPLRRIPPLPPSYRSLQVNPAPRAG